MSLNRNKKILAAPLLLGSCMLLVFASVAFAAPMTGKLKTRDNKPITVNGNKVNPGIAIFSGSQIESPDGVGATIELGALGRLDMAPLTSVTLSFSAGNVHVALKSGYVVLTTKKGVKGSVITLDGKVIETDSSKLSSVIARTEGSIGPEASAQVGAAAGGVGIGTAIGMGAAGAAVISGAAATSNTNRGSSVSPSTPNRR